MFLKHGKKRGIHIYVKDVECDGGVGGGGEGGREGIFFLLLHKNTTMAAIITRDITATVIIMLM
jgi:hypothetical protein